MIDVNNYKKDRTVCKTCFYKNKRKNNINNLLPNKTIENVNNNKDNNPNVLIYENHRHVIIGPSNVGKTYYMLKILGKIGNKTAIHIINRSPNKYPNYKTSDGIKPISKYKGSVVIFDNMLGAKNSSQIDEFFLREEDMNV